MNLGSGACEKNLVLYLGLTVLLFNFGAIGTPVPKGYPAAQLVQYKPGSGQGQLSE